MDSNAGPASRRRRAPQRAGAAENSGRASYARLVRTLLAKADAPGSEEDGVAFDKLLEQIRHFRPPTPATAAIIVSELLSAATTDECDTLVATVLLEASMPAVEATVLAGDDAMDAAQEWLLPLASELADRVCDALPGAAICALAFSTEQAEGGRPSDQAVGRAMDWIGPEIVDDYMTVSRLAAVLCLAGGAYLGSLEYLEEDKLAMAALAALSRTMPQAALLAEVALGENPDSDWYLPRDNATPGS